MDPPARRVLSTVQEGGEIGTLRARPQIACRSTVVQSAGIFCEHDANNVPTDEVQAFIRNRPANLYTDEGVFPEAYAVISRV